MLENDLFLALYARERVVELREIAAARALVVGVRSPQRPSMRMQVGRYLVRVGIRLATGRTPERVSSITGRARVVYDSYVSWR